MTENLKAYEVTYEDDEHGFVATIVWATSPNHAKLNAQVEAGFAECEYIDLRATRAKWADGMRDFSNDELVIEKLKHNWTYWLDDESSARVTELDIPLIVHVGGFSEFTRLFYENQLAFNGDLDRYELVAKETDKSL